MHPSRLLVPLLFTAVVVLGICTGVPALADAPTGNVELGLRSGYTLALGNASAPLALDDVVSGVVPIWFDLGYRTRYLYAGAFFQYGIGLVAGNAPGCAGVNCSANDFTGGIDVQAHLFPARKLDPWVGVGAGYEWLDVMFSSIAPANGAPGAPASHVTLSGWQFIDFQLGLDFRDDVVIPGLGIGPFAMLAFGQYENASASGSTSSTSITLPRQAMHEWLTLGVRGAYDLGFTPTPSPAPAPDGR